MVTKAFSIEDGNLSTKSITTTRQLTFTDIDLTFTAKPCGEIYKKTDAAAVKQAIKNLLLTNKMEKPFDPYFGGNLNSFLFSLSEEFDEEECKESIIQAITNYEPRAIVRDVNITVVDDRHDVKVTIVFQVVNTSEIVSVDVSIARLR